MPMEREFALALLLRQAERRATAQLSALLTGRGSSLEQWYVLSYLSDGTGRAMSEIGAVVMLPPPSMSKLIDSMVGLSLVYRRVDPRDRRRVLVFLTARGHRLHRRLSSAVEQHEADLQELYGAEDLDLLASQLLRLIRQLDAPALPLAGVAAAT